MKARRTIPPAAAPISWEDLWAGLVATITRSPSLERREAEIKAHYGVRYAFLVSSGKAALTLILLALKSLSPRGEVVIPAYTCFSVPSAVRKAGLRLVPCDVDPTTLDFDYDLLEDAISGDTLCVVGHHLFGIPSDIDRLRALCGPRGIFLVEDAAQAMGGSRNGHKLGTLGDVGFFSLGRGKQITCGAGGIIVTNSPRIADAIAASYAGLRAPGVLEGLRELVQLTLLAIFIRPVLYWIPSGLPFLKLGQTLFPEDFPITRLSRTQAAVLGRWRDRLARSNAVRVGTAADLAQRLGLRHVAKDSIPYLRLPLMLASRDQRDRIHGLSRERGLGIALMYPTPVTGIPQLKASFAGRAFPSATEVAERLLTIPTHHLLSERDKRRLCDLLHQAAVGRPPGWAASRDVHPEPLAPAHR